MNKVAPSLLSADFCKMGEAVQNLKKWGSDCAHCDVMDGVFVPNLTFGMPMVAALKKYTEIPLDVHLMIVKPERYVEEFVKAGADILTFHPDACETLDIVGPTLDKIKSLGAKCGLVLNPDKPLELVAPHFDKVDMVVIMSVYAGFGGQSFIEASLDKIAQLKKLIEKTGRAIEIEVDGGVTEANAASIAAAGADVLVAGSAVFKSAGPAGTISILKGESK